MEINGKQTFDTLKDSADFRLAFRTPGEHGDFGPIIITNVDGHPISISAVAHGSELRIVAVKFTEVFQATYSMPIKVEDNRVVGDYGADEIAQKVITFLLNQKLLPEPFSGETEKIWRRVTTHYTIILQQPDGWVITIHYLPRAAKPYAVHISPKGQIGFTNEYYTPRDAVRWVETYTKMRGGLASAACIAFNSAGEEFRVF